MPKTSVSLDLALVGPRPGEVVWRWLYGEVRSAILGGRLQRGQRLPPTREFAERYGISRGTVVAAFEQLRAEGYVQGRVGAGTFVNARLPEDFLLAERSPGARVPAPPKEPALSRFARRLSPVAEPSAAPPRAFRPEPAIGEFPVALWARIASRCMRRASYSLLADCDSRGYRPLREAVADYLGSARGVACTADQVIIVGGIQHALDLTIRLLVDPGDSVCLEDPCHPMVVSMLEVLPSTWVPVPVDAEGFDVDAARRRCRRPRLIYVTPAHQFPLGPTMTVNRRLALLDWAGRSGAWIFEDDYDSEYRYSGRPIPALQGFDPGHRVIFSGSFSKVLLPGLRLGYLVVPPRLVDRFAAARFITDRHSSVLDQAAMCEFLEQGHFGRHIRRTRELFGTRFAALRDALRGKLDPVVTLRGVETGIQTIAWLGRSLDAEALASEAAARGVETVPLRRFVLRAPRPEGLLLGFAAYGVREIQEGVDRLTSVIDRMLRRMPAGRRSGVAR